MKTVLIILLGIFLSIYLILLVEYLCTTIEIEDRRFVHYTFNKFIEHYSKDPTNWDLDYPSYLDPKTETWYYMKLNIIDHVRFHIFVFTKKYIHLIKTRKSYEEEFNELMKDGDIDV